MKFKLQSLIAIKLASILIVTGFLSDRTLANEKKIDSMSTIESVNNDNTVKDKLSAEQVFDKSVSIGLVPSWEAEAEIFISNGKRDKYRRGSAINLKRENERGSLRLFRFVEPVDIAGVSFLIHENGANSDDIWMYLPGLSKTRRILSSSKHDSFMGSDFSYADLMSARTEEYKHEFTENIACSPIDIQESCYVVQSTVISDENVKSLGFKKVITYISELSFLPYRMEYFDKKGERFKTQELSDFTQDLESKTWVAKKRVMQDLEEKSKSILLLGTVKMGEEYEARMFSMKRLGRR